MTTATAARDSALSRVERHADPQWLARAYAAVRNCAANLHEFTSDDVWSELASMRKFPHEPRALGPVMRAAVKAGVCVPMGIYRPSVRVACHARPVMVYKRVA